MAKKGIIYETLNEVKTMQIDKSNDGFMHLSGVFGVCGVRNNNQRVYETKNYAKMVESMQERLKKAPIPGELEHPKTMNITTENISHRIDSITIDENGVVSGEITLLNTPKGKIAQAIVEGGLPLFISSRAQGQIDRNGNVTLENLATYDLVGSPGFSQAELHLNESQYFESICESMCFIGNADDEKTKVNENNNDMDAETLKQIQEELESLKGQIEYLTEQNNMLQEQLDEVPNFDLKQIAEGIQNWIIDEYSPTLQNWIVEEYSPMIENYLTEEVLPELKNSKKDDILNTIAALESLAQPQKETYRSRKSQITESLANEPRFITEMPETARVKWNMASDAVKESIKTRAKIYNFNSPTAINSFWESVSFQEPVKTEEPHYVDAYEKRIRESIKAWKAMK